MTQRYVVVDLETTGNSVKKGDKIIQFAAVVVENNQIVDEYSTFINPEQPLSPFIEELTGIQSSQLVDAPRFSEVAPKIAEILQDSCFVAHNVLFDLTFLQDEFLQNGFEPFYCSTIDTVELAKIIRPQATSFKLSHLAEEEGIEHDRPHQADSDAEVTAQLLINFCEELRKFPLVTLKQLYRLSYSLKSEISELLALILKERMSVSPIHYPHLQIHKGIAIRKPEAISKMLYDGDAVYPESAEEKIALLNKAFPHFELRNDQLKMMDAAYRIFNDQKIAIIEAGTGLGKTLGYLVPAAYCSLAHHEPIIVSTYTIELQNQLIHKELVNLHNMLPFELKTAVLKGRPNYISLAQFDRALRTKDDNYETALIKMQILVWLLQTETGDRDELNMTAGGELFWERLQSAKSPSNDHERSWQHLDFYERAKENAKDADLIVTNHAFLMSDFFSNNGKGMNNSLLIIDEAHQLENAALKHLGSSIDYVSLKMMMNKLGFYDQKQLLYKLLNMVNDLGGKNSHGEADRLLHDVIYEIEQFFQLLSKACEDSQKNMHNKNAVSLQSILKNHINSQPLTHLAERLHKQLQTLSNYLLEHTAYVTENGQPGKTQLFHLSEMESIAEFFRSRADNFLEYFLRNKDSFLYWVEWHKNSPGQYVYLYSQPISGGQELWHRFFAQQNSVILTSSTLAVKDSFEYIKNKLGLHHHDIETFAFPSPFRYKEKVKLLVASDIPEVNKVSQAHYVEQIAQYIEQAALACKGRMLVLFTAQEMLRDVHESLKKLSSLEDFNLLSQGISSNSKTRLIKYFQNFDKSILLGTSSFWDGLDLPGETLQCLMIVRLPFSPPNEPLTEARCDQIRNAGGNPFTEYALPEAIMRFRQGFGRLIRTNEDKGIFIVCDRRIVTTQYGKDFLLSIPDVAVNEVNLQGVQNSIKQWLK